MIQNSRNLREIGLDENQIEIIPDDLFQNHSKLEQIWLSKTICL